MEKLISSCFRSFDTHYSSHCLHGFLYSLTLYLFIRNANGLDPLIQLPHSTSGLYRNDSSISTTILNIDDFGAKGNGHTDDTRVFRDVWKKACTSSSPQRIVVSAGKTYLVGPIDFAGPCNSKVTLRVLGTIVAPRDPDVWDGKDRHKWLYFHSVKDLIVEGGGIINGRGQKWWARSCKTNETNPCRHAPTALTFHRCNSLNVRNIMLIDSQQMHVAFTTSKSIAVSHLRILAPARSPNTDGIHISASSHVIIKSSTISTGDDCISIVSNSSRIRIRNIFCGPGHGISIGSLGKSGSWAEVHDVQVIGAILSNTGNGVRIKTWQGGRGFAKMISFQHIWMQNVSNPIIIDQYYCDSPRPCQNHSLAVDVDAISFIGIKGTSATEEAMSFACSDKLPCTNIYLEDVQLFSHRGGVSTRSFCWEAYAILIDVNHDHSVCSPTSDIQ